MFSLFGSIVVNPHMSQPIITEQSLLPMRGIEGEETYIARIDTDGGLKYHYIAEVAPGVRVPRSIDAEYIRIIEDGQNKLVHYGTPSVEFSWWWWIAHYKIEEKRPFEFHVPEGSIKDIFRPFN